MTDVHGVVYAEPDGEHNGDAGDDINGHVPEVEHPHDIHQGQDHAHQHQQADPTKGDVSNIQV